MSEQPNSFSCRRLSLAGQGVVRWPGRAQELQPARHRLENDGVGHDEQWVTIDDLFIRINEAD
jgi:hypothetical protein